MVPLPYQSLAQLNAGRIITRGYRNPKSWEDLALDNLKNSATSIPIRSFASYPESPDVSLESLRQRYGHHFLEQDVRPCGLYPGVRDTLDALKSEGHSIAVATGKSRAGLDRVLGNMGWENYFHASRCADETLSKPNPLMLSELLAELDYSAADAMMVGDTEFDLEMAANAGMRRIGVSYGAHSRQRLSIHTPEAIIDNMKELTSLL